MELNRVNFFNDYIFHPFSNDLATGDKIKNFLLSFALFFISLSAIHFYCYFTAEQIVEKSPEDDKTNQLFQFTIASPKRELSEAERNFSDALKEVKQKAPKPIKPKDPREKLKDLKHDAPLLDPKEFGLAVTENNDLFPRSKSLRNETTQETVKAICRAVNKENVEDLATVNVDDCRNIEDLVRVKLYKTNDNNKAVLGHLNVLATPCSMNYDKNWKPNEGNQKFFVHHAAGINLSENPELPFNEDQFLENLGSIFYNILKAQSHDKIKHSVWSPFGMGSFLRHLPFVDNKYADPQIFFELRKKITAKFFNAVSKFPNLKICFCLPMNKNDSGAETNLNYNAFIQTLALSPEKVQKAVHLYVNTDAAALAQDLANEANLGYDVGLVNCTNQNLVGDAWLKEQIGGQDENLHRRSTIAALLTTILSKAIVTRPRLDIIVPQPQFSLFGLFSNILSKNPPVEAPREELSFAERVGYFGGETVNLNAIPDIIPGSIDDID